MKEPKTKDILVKIADSINTKRRQELLSVFSSNSDFQKYLAELKKSEKYAKGSKSKVWRKIASMPVEVDQFFTRIYGKDYYKEEDFFIKYAKEWMVFDSLKS